MYFSIYFLLLFVTLVIGNKVYHSFFNPISIWASLWSMIGILSNLAFFDYYLPSEYVNNVIILGIIIYTFFCVLYSTQTRTIIMMQLNKADIINNIDYRVFITINIGAIIIEIPYFIRALKILLSNGFRLVYLRGVLTSATKGVISGGFMSIVRDSGVKNIFTLSAIYAACLLVTNVNYKYKKKIIFIALIEMIEYSITNAARLYLVNFVIYIIFAILLLNGQKIIQLIRTNKKIILVLIALVIFGLLLQNSRASDTSLLKSFYIYYCSGPSYLTQLLSDSNAAVKVNKDYFLGTVSFGFLSNIYYYLKIAFTGINNSTVKLVASVLTIKQYFVGEHTYINAMCTCFYPFLLDWGNVGAIIGPTLASFFSCHYFKQIKKRRYIGDMAICIFVFWVMYYSLFKWNLLNIDFTVILLLNYFICPRRGQKLVCIKR